MSANLVSSRSLLTVEEAAERLAVRPGTIRSWLGKGLLPRVKCGRCTRIPADAVEIFIAAHTTPARCEHEAMSDSKPLRGFRS
jgi:excisionase family DNA binding protein